MKSNTFVSPLRFWMSAVGAAEIELGVRAYKRGDFGSALLTFNPLADTGNRQAQFYLGEMYAGGHGVDVEMDTAISWFEAASSGGYVPAQRRLGELYLHGGEGLARDGLQAHKWLSLAAENGDEQARHLLEQGEQMTVGADSAGR